MRHQGGEPINIGEEVKASHAYFRALQRDASSIELTRDAVQRMIELGDVAQQRIHSDRVLRECPPHIRSQLLEEATAIRDGLYLGSRSPGADTYWSREALELAVRPIAERLALDRAEFKRMIEAETARMSAGDAGRLARVNREIVSGLGMSGLDQGECLRTARAEALDLVADASGNKNPLGWLLLGWLTLWNSSTSAEAGECFSTGLDLLPEKRGLLAHLLLRYRAITLDTIGKSVDALTDAVAGLALHSSPGLCLEAARYATQCGARQHARTHLLEAIRLEPLNVFAALADPELNAMERVTLSGYSTAQAAVRREAMTAIDHWQNAVDDVRKAERALGSPLDLPNELCNGQAELRGYVAKSNLLENFGVRAAVYCHIAEMLQIAGRRLSALVTKRASDADEAQVIVDAAIKKHETVAQRAEEQAAFAISQLGAQIRRAATQDDRAMQGCSIAMGGGFAMFITYVVVAGFLTQAHVNTGPDSPVGMIGITMIGAPILIGLGTCLSKWLRDFAACSELEQRAEMARAKTKVALVDVEKECAKRADLLRAEAAALHDRTRVAAEALRIVTETPRPAGVSPALPAPSKLAA